MLLGILSDSHDHMTHIARAVTLFREHEVELVIHAGDMINPGTIRHFDGVRLAAVLGNNDGDLLGLSRAFDKIGGTLHGSFADLTLAGLRTGVYHGTEAPLKEALIGCGHYDILIFGHTHKVDHRRQSKCTILNPGTAHGFNGKATAMVFNTDTRESTLLELR